MSSKKVCECLPMDPTVGLLFHSKVLLPVHLSTSINTIRCWFTHLLMVVFQLLIGVKSKTRTYSRPRKTRKEKTDAVPYAYQFGTNGVCLLDISNVTRNTICGM